MNQEMSQALEQLFSKLTFAADVKAQVALLGNHVAILGDSVCKLQDIILGNGKPGHTTRLYDVESKVTGMAGYGDRLRNVEEDVKDLKDWHTEWKQERLEQKKEMRTMRNSIIVAVIMLVITTLLNLFLK